jgi:WD40 repeat protein/serine/threonine protein kinase
MIRPPAIGDRLVSAGFVSFCSARRQNEVARHEHAVPSLPFHLAKGKQRMSSAERPVAGGPALLPDEGRAVDMICDRFEADWKAGRRPQVEPYLDSAPPALRAELLRELLALELDYRSREGETPAPAEYRQRFPQNAEVVRTVFAEVSSSAPAPESLLLKWGMSRLVRHAQRMSGSGSAVSSSSALPINSPEPGLLASVNEDVPTIMLRQGVPEASDPNFAATQSSPEATRGRWLGDYQLLERVGKGGMGIVYRAWQRTANRIVALKVIRPDRLEDLLPEHRDEWLGRFRREGQIAARVQHDHVVPVYEVGEIEGKCFHSMRFIEGQSLSEIVRQEPVPSRRAAAFLEPIARAVHAMHCLGIVHRDLKPRNILLDKQDRPYVSDFGLARWSESYRDLTHSGSWVGTPSYMSPEQAQNPTGVGPAGDVYSLGATLYDMLTSRPPFKAADPVITLHQVIEQDPVPPRKLNPAIDRDLELICLKCLRKEPERRYASAEQLADELRRYLNGEPLLNTKAVSAREHVWRWCRRQPALAAASAVAAALFLAVIGLSIGFGVHSSSAAVSIRQKQEQTAKALAKNELLKATLELERGLSLCEQGDAGRGLLWLARSLTSVPADADGLQEEAADLQRTIRLNLGAWRRHICSLKAAPVIHQGPVNVVAFSPDGNRFLTGSWDGTVRILDAVSGKELTQFKPPHFEARSWGITGAAWSPDGKTILTVDAQGNVKLCEAGTGRLIFQLKTLAQTTVMAVAIAPDGKTLLTGSDDRSARTWDATTGAEIRQFNGHRKAVTCVAFSPDGKTILTGSEDNTARLWNADTSELLHELNGHEAEVRAVAFCPDGRFVATASKDNTARLWDTVTGTAFNFPLVHQGGLFSVTFNHDGKFVLTGSEDRIARVWHTATCKVIQSISHPSAVKAAVFSPDGNVIVTGSADNKARLWQANTDKVLGEPLEHPSWVWSVLVSPDGRELLTGGNDGSPRLWSVARKIEILRLGKRTERARYSPRMAFSPDGRVILATNGPGSARLWDAQTGLPIGKPLVRHGTILAVAFSPDGKTVLTAGGDSKAQLWDAVTGEPLGEPLPHRHVVSAVAYSPTDRTILTGSWDGLARIWDVNRGKLVHSLVGHQGAVWSVAFSSDGKTVLTGSADGTARLWDAATGISIGPPLAHFGDVRHVIFSPGGETCLTSSKDGTARLWHTGTGAPLGHPLLHQEAIPAIAFSPTGLLVLTGSHDKTARLWDARTGKPIGPPLVHQGMVESVAFHPDGQLFVTGSSEGKAFLWATPLPPQEETEQIALWTEVQTGLRLFSDGTFRELDAPSWEQCRERLWPREGLTE